MEPIVNGLAQEFAGEINVYKLDAAEQESVRLQQSYGLRGHPSFALVDSEGQLVQTFVGPQPEEVLREALTTLLSAKN
jgi:thioredoxin-like negative regulator of GroEL